MNSKNPFFKSDTFSSNKVHDAVIMDMDQTMTVAGTINKSFILLLLLVLGALGTWNMVFNDQNAMVFTIGGAIVGFILVLITSFNPIFQLIYLLLMQFAKGYLLVGFLRS
jgi:uncharacterized YccA/Bax inhibitor family protein